MVCGVFALAMMSFTRCWFVTKQGKMRQKMQGNQLEFTTELITSDFIYSAVFIDSIGKIRSLIIYRKGSMLEARNEKAAS